jgi:copper chaperone
MIALSIPDMSCGHCTGVITNTVKALDPAASLQFEMENHRVNVETAVPVPALLAALDEAGYPATIC